MLKGYFTLGLYERQLAEIPTEKILPKVYLLHGPSMFAVKAKIYGVLYNQASSIAFDETSSYWSTLKSS